MQRWTTVFAASRGTPRVLPTPDVSTACRRCAANGNAPSCIAARPFSASSRRRSRVREPLSQKHANGETGACQRGKKCGYAWAAGQLVFDCVRHGWISANRASSINRVVHHNSDYDCQAEATAKPRVARRGTCEMCVLPIVHNRNRALPGSHASRNDAVGPIRRGDFQALFPRVCGDEAATT